MKKTLTIAACTALFCSGFMTACYNDDSTLGTLPVGKIVIEPIEDKTVISYSGNSLEYTPKINSDYAEDQLTYNWYIYIDSEYKAQKMKEISTEKHLSYEVNLSPGSYKIALKVSAKDNNYSAYTTFRLKVSTIFTQGFYLMKETADGNTDIDLYSSEGMNYNLFQALFQRQLKGAPRKITGSYDQCFIDPSTNKTSSGNVITVTTEANEIASLKTTDLSVVGDRSTLLFGEMEADDLPYGVVRGVFRNFFFSSKGVRSTSIGKNSASTASGKYGIPLGVGASPFFQLTYNCAMVYWDEISEKLMTVDYNATSCLEVDYVDVVVPDQSNYKCIASGVNNCGSWQIVYFIFDDQADGNRYIYLINARGKVIAINQLDPSLHIAQSNIIAENGFTATVVYSVHNNKVYAYDYVADNEYEVAVPGLSADATITYLSNRYWNMPKGVNDSANFNYFVVGVQQADQYEVYMYEMLGGLPQGDPIHIVTGNGKLKGICFTAQVDFDLFTLFDSYPIYSYNQ